MAGESPKTSAAVAGTVVAEYIKSQFFRVVHTDGAIGGPTPGGNIHMAFYSERPAIPRRVAMSVQNGMLGEPIAEETVIREGLIREMDVDVVMNMRVAEELAKLLLRTVAEMKIVIESRAATGSES